MSAQDEQDELQRIGALQHAMMGAARVTTESSALQGHHAVFRDTEHGRVCAVCGCGPFVDDVADRAHRAWHYTFHLAYTPIGPVTG